MIHYEYNVPLTAAQLQNLFLSVEWSSGHFPEKLTAAMQNYPTVVTAWEDDLLVGLISVMDDGVMNAYVHYMLIRPGYQGQGIGKKLISAIKEKYKDYLRIVLVSYAKEAGFYKNCGFKQGDECVPMFITSLWT